MVQGVRNSQLRVAAVWGAASRPLSSSFWTTSRVRAVRHGLWVAGVMMLLVAAAVVATGSVGLDAHAYWAAWRNHLYSAVPEQRDAYLYSPAFAEAIWPLTLLPWPLFCTIWIGAVTVVYLWLLAPLDLRWRIPLLMLCADDIATGNVWSFFALVLVVGFRFPAVWAFPLLTKVTPVVGPLWFFIHRDWRALAIALGTTSVVAGISFAAAPTLWEHWVSLLVRPESFQNPARGSLRPLVYLPTSVSLGVGLPVAIAITAAAARTKRLWLLPVAMVFAEPVFTSNALVMLAAIPRLAAIGRASLLMGTSAPVATHDGSRPPTQSERSQVNSALE
jgi:Glycosyltransferase family 87